MTPAQKETYQIIDKYRTIIRKADKYDYLWPHDEIYLAKECAIIHVNGIIDKDGYRNDYYKEVLTEIEKL